MNKKIATLEVYVDTTPGTFSGTSGGHGHYELRIAPEDSRAPIETMERFRTVLAHELGHFVALLTKDPTHKPEFARAHLSGEDPRQVIPAEKKAWALAHLIYPNLDREDEMLAAKSYGFTPDTSTWKLIADDEARLTRKARIWEFSLLGFLVLLYSIAGLVAPELCK